MTFRCGHPREPGNTYTRPGDRHQTCALCKRVRMIVRQVGRDQRRINEGRFYNRGERIARGIA